MEGGVEKRNEEEKRREEKKREGETEREEQDRRSVFKLFFLLGADDETYETEAEKKSKSDKEQVDTSRVHIEP